ncbi:calcium-binding protein, partial [Schinkia azotoformans]|uniref:calcium-binding protein n=1 Tax=Schinkia azotoformans TaxID=1454 RepID=UPI002DBDAEE2
MATIQEVIDYVNSWRAQNGIADNIELTPQQELQFAKDLQTKIGDLSFKAPTDGATITPYNGSIGNEPAWRIAQATSQSSGGKLIYISDIEAGKLLNDLDFKEAVVRAVGENGALANNIINGTKENGIRTPYGVGDVLSVNDFVSQQAMKFNAKGNVLTFTAGSTVDSVWTLTELPTLLEMSEVTSIDGIPKEELLHTKNALIKSGLSEQKALNVMREIIAYKSNLNMSSIDIYMGENNKILGVDTSKLTGRDAIMIPEGIQTRMTAGEMMGQLSEAEFRTKYSSVVEIAPKNPEVHNFIKMLDQAGRMPETDFNSAYPTLTEIIQNTKIKEYQNYRGKILKGAGVVGGIMLTIDAINMVSEATKAYKAGDTDRGNKIVRDWTIETMGGFASAAVAMEAVAPYALALGTAGGPLGIAAGITVELVAGVAGWMAGSQIGHIFSELLDRLFGQASGATRRIDPIVLDLDGDGIETVSLQNGIYFDLDNNGFAEKSGWIKSDDGFLVLDRDGNGEINGGRELFGDQTILKNGTVASSGYEALAELDDNKDGKIDNQDGKFADLRIWRDLNQDGLSSERELFGLEQLGIKSLNLAYSNVNIQDSSGNIVSRKGSFEKTDGTLASLGEYLFSRNTLDTIAREWVETPKNMESLPDINGLGSVYSLKQAMVRDSSGELRLIVEAFSSETNVSKRNAMMDNILFKWTNSSNIDPKSRGGNFDARKLAVLEKFNGRSFTGTNGSNPISEAVPILTQAYNELVEKVYCKLLYQTHLSEVFDRVNFNWNYETNEINVNSIEVREIIEKKINSNLVEGLVILGELSRVLKGCDLVDNTEFSNFRHYFEIKGKLFSDVIDTRGENLIFGTDKNDNLLGFNTNDLLAGGAGNDRLEGGYGNDVYLFGRGSDQDTIYDYDSTAGNMDVIRMAEDVAPSDIIVKRNGNHLELRIGGTPDKLIVQNYFSHDNYQVEKIEFADGTVWDVASIKAAVTEATEENDEIRGYDETNDKLYGLGGNDTLYGVNGDDHLDGGAGDDKLYRGNGADILLGGTGNDTLYGEYGNDLLDGGQGH